MYYQLAELSVGSTFFKALAQPRGQMGDGSSLTSSRILLWTIFSSMFSQGLLLDRRLNNICWSEKTLFNDLGTARLKHAFILDIYITIHRIKLEWKRVLREGRTPPKLMLYHAFPKKVKRKLLNPPVLYRSPLNLMVSSLGHAPPLSNISWKSVQYFFVILPTDRKTSITAFFSTKLFQKAPKWKLWFPL